MIVVWLLLECVAPPGTDGTVRGMLLEHTYAVSVIIRVRTIKLTSNNTVSSELFITYENMVYVRLRSVYVQYGLIYLCISVCMILLMLNFRNGNPITE